LVAAPAEIAGVRIDVRQWAPEHKAFTVVTPQPTLLKIKLLNYPAWQARLDGRAAPLRTDPETGQMLLPAPAGSTQAEITFTRTWDRTAGILVTLASVLLLGLLGWRYRGHGDAGPGSILRR
jgi:hypothetical protein